MIMTFCVPYDLHIHKADYSAKISHKDWTLMIRSTAQRWVNTNRSWPTDSTSPHLKRSRQSKEEMNRNQLTKHDVFTAFFWNGYNNQTNIPQALVWWSNKGEGKSWLRRLKSQIFGSVPGDFISNSWQTKWHWSKLFYKFLLFAPANHHSTTDPQSSVNPPLKCAIALTRQHTVTYPVLK